MASFPPLALRLLGQDHALEPGRDYLLGSAGDCDLVVPAAGGAAAHQAMLRVGEQAIELVDLSGDGTCHNGTAVERAALQPGDTVRLGAIDLQLVVDAGHAILVPLPALRAAARSRRQQQVRLAAAALMRRRDSESFQDLMANELRRAPWLGTSLLVHALLLLALWLLLPAQPGGDDTPSTVSIDFTSSAPPGDPLPTVPDVAVEPPAVDFTPELPDDPEPSDEPPPTETMPAEPRRSVRENPRLAPRTGKAGSAGDARIVADVRTVGSGGFRRTVAELRDSGLEIVFVIDSTGSMSHTILDTKQTIAQMLTVLRALVPDARVGIVAFRDRGKREQYVVRQMPLGLDFWRASNFVESVSAEGGGDQPEDVRAGLRAAFRQRWEPRARRVVVLAGDAPPHDEDVKSLLADVRAFARDGRSFVHALVTSPRTIGQEARRSFTDIAAAGDGACLDLHSHEKVLQRVLTLAFGRDFEHDVAAVMQTVAASADQVDVESLDLAHRGGDALQRALRQDPVPSTLLNALVRRPRRGVALELIDQVGSSATPEHTRHAIAWALQRVLDLSAPPVDPERGDPPEAALLAHCRTRCETLPD